MTMSVLQSGFTVSLLETLQVEDRLKAAFRLAIGISILIFDGRTKGETYN